MSSIDATWSGLCAALNGADLVGVGFDLATSTAVVTFVPAAPVDPDRGRRRDVQLLLHPCTRVAASLRAGAKAGGAAVVPQRLSDLADTVRSFGGLPVRGPGLFDRHERALAPARTPLSLDWRSGRRGGAHSLTVCQRAGDRRLDLRLWFDDIDILDERGMRLRVEDFIA